MKPTDLCTPPQLCKEWQLPDSTLRRWVARLEPVGIQGRRLYWRRQDVELIIKQRMQMRSNYGRPLCPQDLPEHPDPLSSSWLGITALWSLEWHSAWGRALRAELKRLGWRPVRVDSMRVHWE